MTAPNSNRVQHIILRAKERYDLCLSETDVRDLGREARKRHVALRQESNGTLVVLANWHGTALVCVLAGPDRVLTSVLPPQNFGFSRKLKAGGRHPKRRKRPLARRGKRHKRSPRPRDHDWEDRDDGAA